MLHVHLATTEPECEAARVFEAEEFFAQYGCSREVHDHDYGPWEPWTRFLLISDTDQQKRTLVGVIRLIGPGPLGSQTLHAAGGEPWSVPASTAMDIPGISWEGTWDVATIAVRQSPGDRRVGLLAWQSIVRFALVNEISAMAAVLDLRVRSVMSSLGLLVENLPGCAPAPFEGSDASVPVIRSIPALLADLAARRPDNYELMTTARPLVSVVGLEDEALRVP
ncbi:MAG: hypothetical protein ACRC0L_08030, partial [Angustibacter sp.]